jgi:hypothetical protein
MANKEDLIGLLTGDSALRILRKIVEDKDIGEAALGILEKEMLSVDDEDVAEEVLSELMSFGEDDLVARSGRTSHGYVEPFEAAYDMIEEAIYRFSESIKSYRRLNMKSSEKSACAGLIKGLLRYSSEGGSEILEWIPDTIDELVEGFMHDYELHNSAEDVDGLREMIDDERQA